MDLEGLFGVGPVLLLLWLSVDEMVVEEVEQEGVLEEQVWALNLASAIHFHWLKQFSIRSRANASSGTFISSLSLMELQLPLKCFLSKVRIGAVRLSISA